MSRVIPLFNVGRPFFSWTVASPSERLHNMATKASRTLHAHCADTETNPIVFISHIIAPRLMIHSEITTNRCNQIWLCNRSLDGDTVGTLQLQSRERQSDVAQYILALVGVHKPSSYCM